jgi:adenylate cyclase
MHVDYSYKDILQEQVFCADDIVIGRHEAGVNVDLDLRFDRSVSHRHARIWVSDGACWIEDLGSRNGTLINGVRMEPRSARIVKTNDEITVGETKIRFDAKTESNHHGAGSNITLTLDAVKPAYKFEGDRTVDTDRRLAVLYDLPLQFGDEIQFDALLAKIVQKLLEVIRGSARAALVLRDPASGALLLKAHVPVGKPCVSMTLAQRTLKDQVAFVWQRNGEPAATQALDAVDCAMYAPLLWRGLALGAACVDNYAGTRVFNNDDLRLLVAIAQYGAMAVANQQLQEQLRRESTAKANLLRQFSPKIAERLLKYRGPSLAGGERSDVTILFADIREFSKLTRSIGVESVVELLSSYFNAINSIIFSHDGTVVQIVGDTIFAVFGSPEPDSQHYEKALCAAVEVQQKIVALNSMRETEGKSICHFGIGVHCGEVIHGFIGGPDSVVYTALGDPVNRTARYCAAAKADEVLISPELYERVWRIIRDAEPVTVNAKFEEQFAAYRVHSLWEH